MTRARAAVIEDSTSDDLIRVYLREIGKRPLLKAEEEVGLAKAIEAGTKAAERLQKSNGKLAASTKETLRRRVNEGERAQREFIEATLRTLDGNEPAAGTESAPRALKLPVGFTPSSLTQTRESPIRSAILGTARSGVSPAPSVTGSSPAASGRKLRNRHIPRCPAGDDRSSGSGCRPG